jgi:hypothetical protein
MLRSAIKPLVILVVLLIIPYSFNSQGLTEQPITIQTLTTSAGGVVIRATRIDLPTNDLIYDPVSGKIYASVPSTAGSYGNRIVPITVPTATLGTPIYVGSEPNRLAVSDNGQYLYVGLDGAAAVQRVNLFTQIADLQFSLGSGFCGSFLAEDMVVLKGNPSAVAISRRNTGCSPRHEGVAIYDDGVPRSVSTPGHTGSNVIEPSDSPSILYGYNNETTEFGFRVMSVNNSGVQVTSVREGLLSGFGVDIRFDNGLVYATSGRVINPSTLTLVGTYAASGPVCPDSSTGRVYFLSGYGSIQLKIFDQSTFVSLGEVTIPTTSGSPGSFIKAGEDVLAFRTTAGQVFLLQFVELNHQVYLPLVLKSYSTGTGIYGRVTLNGAPAANVYLQLRFFDGSQWSTRSTTYTDQNGNYAFTSIPSLGPNQRYYVLYSNSAGTSGRLRAWGTRELTSYTAGTAVEIGNFDIADIPLVAPSDGATVSLPYTFRWTRRPATPSDSYALALYDSSNYAHTSPLGYVDSVLVNNLPPFVTPGTQYWWEVLAFSPDGGVGISLQARRVTFTNTGVGSLSEAPDFSLSPPHLLEER